ncbi:hypothetical protein Pcinc_037997, partial [Petrolisthes cinctipes]
PAVCQGFTLRQLTLINKVISAPPGTQYQPMSSDQRA